MKLISFVFSFRNEEKNLKSLIDRVHKSVKKTQNWDYEKNPEGHDPNRRGPCGESSC